MATNGDNNQGSVTLTTRYVDKIIPTDLQNWFPEDKPHRQLWFVQGLLFSSIVTHYAMLILITFLIDELGWGLKLLIAVLITNLQEGLTGILEIIVQYFANAFLGYKWMLGLTTIAYSIGLVLLKYSYPHFTKTEKDDCENNNHCVSKPLTVSFYIALILITLGQSGTYLSLDKFEDMKDKTAAADDQDNPRERSDNDGRPRERSKKEKLTLLVNKILVKLKLKGSIAFPWLLVRVAGSAIGIFVVSYDPHRWTSQLEICACLMGGSFCFYFLGTLFYPPKRASGSSHYVPRVIVAAFRNKDRRDNGESYNPDGDAPLSKARPRCLNRAAIMSESAHRNIEDEIKDWRLCTVREVEDTKRLMRIIPLTTTFFMYGIVHSIGRTFFLAQACKMDSRLGRIKEFPLQALVLTSDAVAKATSWIYDCVVEWKKVEDVPYKADGIKIGLGMAMSFICCSAALVAEKSRLRIIREHNLLGDYEYVIPMSVFWLVPQFVALGAMDGLARDGIQSFFEHEQSPSMKEYAAAFADGVTGAGTCFTLAAIFIIQGMTKGGENPSWFANSVDESRLDLFYKALLVVCGINFVSYVAIALFYWRNETKQSWNQNQSVST